MIDAATGPKSRLRTGCPRCGRGRDVTLRFRGMLIERETAVVLARSADILELGPVLGRRLLREWGTSDRSFVALGRSLGRVPGSTASSALVVQRAIRAVLEALYVRDRGGRWC